MKQNWGWVREGRISSRQSDNLVELFTKSLKLALEFEFNLPGLPGTCVGDSFHSQDGLPGSDYCPCSNKDRFGCKDRCAVSQICSTIPTRAKCAKNFNGSCSFADYPVCPKPCDRFEFSCIGESCSDFQAPCNHGCVFYSRDCSSCSNFVNNPRNPAKIRSRAVEIFKPSNAIEDFGDTGVEKVDVDSSLLGDEGVEICTVGRRMNIPSMWSLNRDIIRYCSENGAYVSNRCSIHMHALISHFPQIDIKRKGYIKHDSEVAHKSYAAVKEYTEMETPIPSIVLTNLVQIVRRFTPALVWITSTGQHKSTLTRWAKYRQPFVHMSPLVQGLDGFINECASTFSFHKSKPQDKGKYGFINFNHVVFGESSKDIIDSSVLRRFHIENRIADGNMSPTAVTAFMALFYAMIIKAVRISRYGTLEAFSSKEEETKTLSLSAMILNNNPEGWGDGDRNSDTSGLFKTGHDVLIREDCLILLDFLRNELYNTMGMDKVLYSLAEKPISLRLSEGKPWNHIENELFSMSYLCDNVNTDIEEIIDTLGLGIRSSSVDSWIECLLNEYPDELKISKEELEEGLKGLVKSNKIRWSETSGSFIRA